MFERPGVLSVGDQVVFDGTVQTVVAISGTKIRLLSDAGQASVVALPFLLSAEDFELVGSGPAAPKIEPRGLLDALPDKANETRIVTTTFGASWPYPLPSGEPDRPLQLDLANFPFQQHYWACEVRVVSIRRRSS